MPIGRHATTGVVPARLRRLALGVLLASSASLGLSPSAGAASLEQLEQQGLDRIIVKRERNLSAAERADVRNDADVDLVRRLALADTEVVEAAPGELSDALARLERDPDVVYAEPDVPVSATSNDSFWIDMWALENQGQAVNRLLGLEDADIDAPDAWLRTTGQAETVAVIDSGVDFGHPDLQGQFAVNPGESGGGRETNGRDDDGNGFVDDHRGWDWVGQNNTPDDGNATTPEDEDNLPADTNGHGTHVAGIIAARQDNGIGITGIAPGAKVLPLRVLDADGDGYSSDAAEALAYAGRQGYRIVNASLGVTAESEYVQTMQAAIAAHPRTLYVIAAGNGRVEVAGGPSKGVDNDAIPFYPCALPEANIVCVGASDSSDRRAGFSNFGTKTVDLHAPGVSIRSSYKSSYAFMDGTSMATPYVAGTVALVASIDRSAGPAGLKNRVLASTDRVPDLANQSLTGGRLNAAAAVAAPAGSGGGNLSPVQEPAPAAPAPRRSAPAPAPTAPRSAAPAPVAATGAPALLGVRLSGRTLKSSLKLSFKLDRAASVRVKISRQTCRAGRCKYKPTRTITVAGAKGPNSYVVRRGAGGRKLAAGRYRLTVQAVDGRLASRAGSASFTVR